MKLYKGIIFCLSALTPFMIVSCSEQEPMNDVNQGMFEEADGFRDVSIDISMSDFKTATRADEASIISQGSKIDKLTYAIYSRAAGSADNVAYKIDSQYGGQTTVDFKTGETYQLNIKISVNREYAIACWAQSGSCKAYDVTDLEAVKVSYINAVNNDETRDAFSASAFFSGKEKGVITVELRRPFAQINVGTSGADYAALIYDPAILPNGVRINQSEISVKGVADTYNVLTGTATASTNLTASFSWANLPAWITSGIPKTGNYTGKNTDPFVATEGEEFLQVEMNGDEVIEDYKTSYETVDKNGKYLTETFKYLSMCYVLVPGGNGKGANVDVTFNLRDNSYTKPITLIARVLQNVPVEGNYRTNILGGLYYMSDPVDNPQYPGGPTDPDNPDNPDNPDDPDDPDNPGKPDDPGNPDKPIGPDPTSIFGINTFSVILQDNFDYHHVIKWKPENNASGATEKTEPDTTTD